MTNKIYLRRDFLGGEQLADGGADELDVAIFVIDHLVGDLHGLLVHLRHLPPNEPLHKEERVLHSGNSYGN
jgi:hypothetical protein